MKLELTSTLTGWGNNIITLVTLSSLQVRYFKITGIPSRNNNELVHLVSPVCVILSTKSKIIKGK